VTLNVKQEAFCLHYAKTGNATEAYKEAGYKVKTERSAYAASNKLLKNVKVQARLKELADEIASDKIASIKEIQEYLTSVMRRERNKRRREKTLERIAGCANTNRHSTC
jgi:phage terminase small subunit